MRGLDDVRWFIAIPFACSSDSLAWWVSCKLLKRWRRISVCMLLSISEAYSSTFTTIYLGLPKSAMAMEWMKKEATSNRLLFCLRVGFWGSTKYTSRFTIQQWIIDIDGQLNIYLPLRRFWNLYYADSINFSTALLMCISSISTNESWRQFRYPH